MTLLDILALPKRLMESNIDYTGNRKESLRMMKLMIWAFIGWFSEKQNGIYGYSVYERHRDGIYYFAQWEKNFLGREHGVFLRLHVNDTLVYRCFCTMSEFNSFKPP